MIKEMEEGELCIEEGEIAMKSLVPKFNAHKVNPFKCDLCNFKTSSGRALNKHKFRKHKIKPVVCEQCDFQPYKKGGLNRHKLEVHNGNLTYKEGNFVDSKLSLTDQQKVRECNRLKCLLCEYTCLRRSSLEGHTRIKHQGIQFECEICDYKANWKCHLVFHKRSVHEKIVYECDKCNYKNVSKRYLKSHMKCQHEGFRFKCEECGNTYSSQSGLSTHKRQHKGLMFQCDQCSFKSVWKLSVTDHKKILHEGVKVEKVTNDMFLKKLAKCPIKTENLEGTNFN